MPLVVNDTFYGLDEAAKQLGLTLRTVRNHINTGLISAIKLGSINGARVISGAEIERFKRERRPRGNPAFVSKQSQSKES